MSFGSSNYFNIVEDDEENFKDDTREVNPSSQIERRIDEWLISRDIFRADPGLKKEIFFEDRRLRVNSISFIGHLKDTESTEASAFNFSNSPARSSLQLTPENSKICQKRSSFASMLEITTSKDFSACCNEDEDESLDLPRWRRQHTNSDHRCSDSAHYQEHSLRGLGTPLSKLY